MGNILQGIAVYLFTYQVWRHSGGVFYWELFFLLFSYRCIGRIIYYLLILRHSCSPARYCSPDHAERECSVVLDLQAGQ